MTKEEKELTERFERIKQAAWKKNTSMVDLEYMCDIVLYDKLVEVFNLYRVSHALSQSEARKKGDLLKSAYFNEVRNSISLSKLYRDLQDRLDKSRESMVNLIHNADKLTDIEIAERSLEINGLALNVVDAKVIVNKAARREEHKMIPIIKNESEKTLKALLLSLNIKCRVVDELIKDTKQRGTNTYSKWAIRYEGEKFSLYRIPEVISC